MDITNRDIEETKTLKEILRRIDEMEQDREESIYTKIYENQPFILSLMMAYEAELDEENIDDEQFGAMRDMLFMIYLFFEQKTNIQRAQVTEQAFIKQFQLNIEFMEYLSGEEDPDSQLALSEADLSKMHFISLYTAIVHIAHDYLSFQKMDDDSKAAIFLEMKTLIECLESCLVEK